MHFQGALLGLKIVVRRYHFPRFFPSICCGPKAGASNASASTGTTSSGTGDASDSEGTVSRSTAFWTSVSCPGESEGMQGEELAELEAPHACGVSELP